MERLLILSNVHVEPTSSAAGRRMLQLIHQFKEKGYHITYATTFGQSDHAYDLTSLEIESAVVQVNDPAFDAWVADLSPEVVLFDRFMVEEQFGWRVRKQCPDALRVLDTEDLHCLRYAREAAVLERRPFHDQDLVRDIAFREVASILRSDISLMISSVEMAFLQRVFGISEQILHYLPFLEEKVDDSAWKSFEERKHFVSIGNFMHTPNRDAVKYLKDEIWPLIRNQMPDAQVHIYGAYPNQQVFDWHAPNDGFHIKGRAEDAMEVISSARVLLAPLRFGAGLKGKLIEAMRAGTPSATTEIGAEGMAMDLPWPGAVETDPAEFAKQAVILHQDPSEWSAASMKGKVIVERLFGSTFHSAVLWKRITTLEEDVERHRSKNFLGQMLWHHSLRSTEFMSKWIEEKNG